MSDPVATGPKYCRVCGSYAHPERPDDHDLAGADALRRSPLLALLFTRTDELNLDAPIILGGGELDRGDT